MNLSAIKKVTAVHNDILKTKVVLYDSSLDSFEKDLVFEDNTSEDILENNETVETSITEEDIFFEEELLEETETLEEITNEGPSELNIEETLKEEEINLLKEEIKIKFPEIDPYGKYEPMSLEIRRSDNLMDSMKVSENYSENETLTEIEETLSMEVSDIDSEVSDVESTDELLSIEDSTRDNVIESRNSVAVLATAQTSSGNGTLNSNMGTYYWTGIISQDGTCIDWELSTTEYITGASAWYQMFSSGNASNTQWTSTVRFRTTINAGASTTIPYYSINFLPNARNANARIAYGPNNSAPAD